MQALWEKEMGAVQVTYCLGYEHYSMEEERTLGRVDQGRLSRGGGN